MSDMFSFIGPTIVALAGLMNWLAYRYFNHVGAKVQLKAAEHAK